ncbi:hypothetical protein YDYSY3_23060 [Paenibacillus chitinolyticus]|uniref:DUF6376 family protein n=1 Tax=Paenibacillus chitinolyticus TaxID=79263 RepID=UPI0026E4B197|nr:DUF6376 family protein [Paenibacillus chitinolyticus]GKS11306.1 hypothetical protein YDYSY3_23060 [Paenibacillus chitinolyticus]
MKIRLVLAVLTVLMLSGCSLLDGVSSTLNYGEEAKTYLQEAAAFAENLPAAARDAATDPQAGEKVKKELEAMRENISSFNGLDAPGFAEDLHKQIVGYNETMLGTINGHLEQLNSQVLDYQSLLQSPVIQQVNEMKQLTEKIQNLGQ